MRSVTVDLIRPVFEHPICDESQGPVDWCATIGAAQRVVAHYRELGYFDGEYPGRFETRAFEFRTPQLEDGISVAIVDRRNGFLWLWHTGMGFDTMRDFWTKEGAKKNPKKLPGEVLSAKCTSGIEKVPDCDWPHGDKFVILQDGTGAGVQAVILVHPSGDSEILPSWDE